MLLKEKVSFSSIIKAEHMPRVERWTWAHHLSGLKRDSGPKKAKYWREVRAANPFRSMISLSVREFEFHRLLCDNNFRYTSIPFPAH
jgi:hypothetical protein